MIDVKEIESTDLRIGNYVTDEYFESFSNVITVGSMNEYGINLYVGNDGDWPEYYIMPEYEYSKLRGIPLTEQRLIELGFEKVDFKHFDNSVSKGVFVKNRMFIEITDDSFITALSVPGSIRKVNYVNSIKYVHQLQNLYYSLTGKELTWKEK